MPTTIMNWLLADFQHGSLLSSIHNSNYNIQNPCIEQVYENDTNAFRLKIVELFKSFEITS